MLSIGSIKHAACHVFSALGDHQAPVGELSLM